MKLNKWIIISKHAEEKKIRTNLKKLGCLFEAFVGAIFLDFNKINVNDEHGWFKNVFICGPGFQMSQKFVESILETHVDWVQLIKTDDNFKNILQVKIQKEFKTTPDYIEMSHDVESGYKMGVFLCIGKELHNFKYQDSKSYSVYGCFENIHKDIEENGYSFVFLGCGTHKIKKKAEQIACEEAIKTITLEK